MKYRLSGIVTISILTEVEADTEQEAIRIAEERGLVSLCHFCASGDPEREWITSGELDGIPMEIRVEA